MKNRELVGSIVLVKGDTFLSKAIIAHMKLYGKTKKKGYDLEYSHAEFIYEDENGVLMTCGARDGGDKVSTVEDYYSVHDNYMILMPVIRLTDEEVVKLREYVKDVTVTNKRKYQWTNFLSWIHYIKTFGKWWIGKFDDRSHYCYELAARAAKLLKMCNWNPNITSIYHLYENPYYKPTNIKFF